MSKEVKREMMKVMPKKDHVICRKDVKKGHDDHYVLKAGTEISVPKMYLETLKTEKVI